MCTSPLLYMMLCPRVPLAILPAGGGGGGGMSAEEIRAAMRAAEDEGDAAAAAAVEREAAAEMDEFTKVGCRAGALRFKKA